LDCQTNQSVSTSATRTTARKPNVMTNRETLKKALEALKTLVERFDFEQFTSVCELDDAKDAIKAIEEALAKQEQGEPVAYVETKEVHGQMCSFIYRIDSTKLLPDGAKLYTTTPQQRTWVGLTDEEVDKIWSDQKKTGESITREIEAKLKEKNT